MIRAALLAAVLASLVLSACNNATTPAATTPVAAAAAWTAPQRVLFMHRSVGGALLRNGTVDMFEVLAELNAEHGTAVELWHHFCGVGPYWNRYYDGDDTWIQPNFGPALEEFPAVLPDQWLRIFSDPAPSYVAARDSIDNFRVILFKSGYDNTVSVASDRAERWRQEYRAIRDTDFVRDPGRRFIVLGFPPMREGVGGATQADADSARAFNTWLVEEFVRGRGNLYGFPFFDRLAGPDNWLRDEYGIVANPGDSHPNVYGCTVVGRELVTFIHAVARQGARPGPEADPVRVRSEVPSG